MQLQPGYGETLQVCEIKVLGLQKVHDYIVLTAGFSSQKRNN